jgi:hypothetical protein
VWHQHGEVEAPTPAELDGKDDEDRMDDMRADIGMEYDLGSGDQHPPLEVQNIYRLLAALDEKVHDGTMVPMNEWLFHVVSSSSLCSLSSSSVPHIFMHIALYRNTTVFIAIVDSSSSSAGGDGNNAHGKEVVHDNQGWSLYSVMCSDNIYCDHSNCWS